MAAIQRKVYIEIKQGIIDVIMKARDVRVVIRDFDVDGIDGEDLKTEQSTGAKYQEIVWEIGELGSIESDRNAVNEAIKEKYDQNTRLQRVFKRMKVRKTKKEDRNVTYGERIRRAGEE